MSVRRGVLRNLIEELLGRVRELRVPSIRPFLDTLRALADRMADHVRQSMLPRIRLSAGRWREHLAGLRGDVSHRAVAPAVGANALHRFAAWRWRLRTSRLGRSADGIIVVPLLGVVLVLGVFTATAATGRSSDRQDSAGAPASTTGDISSGEVVTETIRSNGKTLRIIRYRTKPGRVVLETISGRSVTLPGNLVTLPGGIVTLPGETKTVVHTHVQTQTVTNTVTTQQIVTVTETQPGTTVVVTETVPQG